MVYVYIFHYIDIGINKKTAPMFIGTVYLIVRKKGLEPPRREAPDPKSGAATNYATSALGCFKDCKDRN